MGDLLEAKFKIIQDRDCPLYDEGDEFTLSGLALQPPTGKATCLFLAKEITGILIEKMDAESSGDKEATQKDKKEFNCSGCTGLIKFSYVDESKFYTPQMRMMAAAETRKQTRETGALVSMVNSFSFFQTLEEDSLKDILSCLQMKDFKAGEIVLHKGQAGRNLMFIVSGRVAVADDEDITLAILGRGEIFGEMSLFSGNPVCASIKCVDPVKILMLSGKDLSHILIKYPFLQMAFTRLLVQRLCETNVTQAEKMSQAFSGLLMELPPSELFQMLNENVKSGVVELDLSKGKAQVAFSEGEIVRVQYMDLSGAEAFNEIIKEQKGRFRFSASLSLEEMGAPPIASFMKLLMDGLRKIDEENEEKDD
ncbi:MAG: cyclic nucleotide-binding domain-containing protein [Desulfobulbaceae bacterium]|nr:cyclic nucleotide-binding domain-containing protein [Desulfobulbaceae bacterium]